jgi:hypothetical protein
MLKKDITFEDLDGKKVTKTYYFNMSKRELMALEMETPGGFADKLKFMMITEDAPAVLQVFKLMVDMSIGERHEDNIQFVKSPEITKAFSQTNAYDELLFSFIQDPKVAVEFIHGIMPADFRDKVDAEKVLAEATANVEARRKALDDQNPERQQVARGPKTLTECTEEELQAMPLDELKSRIANAGGNVPKRALVVAYTRSL